MQPSNRLVRALKALWTEPRATFRGRFYQLDAAPLMPKPIQRPHPELMIGGGGERVTLRIVARHADHWNAWAGPDMLRKKSAILAEHCAKVGRDPRTIVRSTNMPLLLTDHAEEIETFRRAVSNRMGLSDADAGDALLAGSVGEMRDKLGRLRDAGAGMVFIPSMFLPADPRPLLDRFMSEVVPAVR